MKKKKVGDFEIKGKKTLEVGVVLKKSSAVFGWLQSATGRQ
jgi:hypothetical protein